MQKASLACALLVVVAALSCQRYQQLKAQVAEEWSKVKPAGSGGGSGLTEGQWTHVDAPDGGGGPADAFTGKCTIPTHQDEYSGFTIGYPSGWVLDYSTDTIIVAKDEKEMTGALVFPARLRRSDVPAERLATLFARGLGRSIARKGGTSQLTEQKTTGKIATAVILANVDGVDLKGPLQVVERPGFVTLKLYWAPKDDFEKEEPTLKQVLTCYQRKMLITGKLPAKPPASRVTKLGYAAKPSGAVASAPVQPLRPYRGRYFSMSIPAGWKIQDENEHGIDVVSADGSEGAGFGFWINPVEPAGVTLQKNLAQYYPKARVLQSGMVPSPAGWSTAVAEFEGPGTHGISRVSVSQGTGLTMGWSAAPQKWEGAKATLAAMIASVQILPSAIAKVQADVRAQLASYPHPAPAADLPGAGSSGGAMSSWDQPESGESRQDRDFDDYIRGQERVTNAAGEEIVAPTSMWNDTGPQGAGYYQATPGGGVELLTPEAPPPTE
ncbi:MAG TPA: hypothetical protein VIF15_08790 [Polyangiaceae bacterium]|jgi:hypothetical protein